MTANHIKNGYMVVLVHAKEMPNASVQQAQREVMFLGCQ
jgi:hypothetical protein